MLSFTSLVNWGDSYFVFAWCFVTSNILLQLFHCCNYLFTCLSLPLLCATLDGRFYCIFILAYPCLLLYEVGKPRPLFLFLRFTWKYIGGGEHYLYICGDVFSNKWKLKYSIIPMCIIEISWLSFFYWYENSQRFFECSQSKPIQHQKSYTT